MAPSGLGSLGNESTTFGPATRAALTTFQDKYIVNLPVTERGTVGAVTRERFNTLVAAGGIQGGGSTPTTGSVSTTTPKTSVLHVTLTKRLLYGMKHPEVTLLQQFLIAQGVLAKDSATGYFGKLTQAALQKYQCATLKVCSGTPASTGYGATGPKTRKQMGG